MDLYRIRIEVADDPGRMGHVLVVLGQVGINVVEIDCHNVDGAVRVDDLLVHLTRPLDIPAIAYAVENAGCPLIEVRPLSARELEDPVIRGMRLIAYIAATNTASDDEIAWCAGELVRSDLACVVEAQISTVDSIAGQALTQNVPVHGREWVKRLPSGDPAWTLAVPFDRQGRRAAVVVNRTSSRFTRTETARLRVLLDAASHTSNDALQVTWAQ